MPERKALAPDLRALDQALEQRGMPSGARNRVETRLRQEAQRREATSGFRFRWLPAVTFAAGAALVLLVVGLQWRSSEPAVLTEDATVQIDQPVLGMFSVHGDDCRHREASGETVLDGECRLVAPRIDLHTWEPVRLRNEGAELRVVDGTVLFEASTVPPGQPPTRIHTSHGRIEVIGTRFSIEQGLYGGHVDLFEGHIRFVSLDEEVTDIQPGQRYSWGQTLAAATGPGLETLPKPAAVPTDEGPEMRVDDVPTASTDVEREVDDGPSRAAVGSRRRGRGSTKRAKADPGAEPEPAPSTEEGTADEAAAVIDEVTKLRSRGHYAEAAAVLRRAQGARRWDRRTAQVMSYELGEIIERHLGDREAACAHWVAHQRRFAGGRYDRAIDRARERLECVAVP